MAELWSSERYPAPGVRSGSYGMLYDAGYSGYSWSSSVSGNSARNLNFYYGEIIPQNGGGRANARQVRCLLE